MAMSFTLYPLKILGLLLTNPNDCVLLPPGPTVGVDDEAEGGTGSISKEVRDAIQGSPVTS